MTKMTIGIIKMRNYQQTQVSIVALPTSNSRAGLIFWAIKSFIVYLVLVISLASTWRAYKILWPRFLRKRRPEGSLVNGKDAVLITGATSGIGLAVAKHLFKLGYSVIAGYYDSKESGYLQLKKLSDTVKANSLQRMIFIEIDVRKQESISRAYKDSSQALKENNLRFFALINNAGCGSLQPFAWLQRATIERLVETNLMGTLMMTREFLPLLISHSKGRGRVLNTSSGLGLIPGATYATYGLTKAAQIYFTRCLNLELDNSSYGIKSVAVIPHNYIKNTNIVASCVKQIESSWNEMKPLERELFQREYDEHLKRMRSLEEAWKKQSKLMTNERSSSRQANPSSSRNASTSIGVLVKPVWDFIMRMKGSNEVPSIEESGTLECFEDALWMDDPPEHIFAGDNIYNILVGTIFLCLPDFLISLLSLVVSPSLYK